MIAERIAVVVAIAAVLGAYAFGRHDGKSNEVASQSRASAAASSASASAQRIISDLTASAAVAEQDRQQTVKEIHYAKERIIERPVYRNVCVDADGLRIIQAATDVANGQSRSGIVDRPSEASAAAKKP